MATYTYQRKSLRFSKTARFKVTAGRTPVTILEAALANTPTTISGIEDLADATAGGNSAFVSGLTSDSWEAGAISELETMWNVLARCHQCLVNNGLATTA